MVVTLQCHTKQHAFNARGQLAQYLSEFRATGAVPEQPAGPEHEASGGEAAAEDASATEDASAAEDAAAHTFDQVC